MAATRQPDDDTPVFVISVAAELAGMHAQTLRQYDRLGLVTPKRTRGGGRRYSPRDVDRLREVQRLSQEEGVSLAGVQRIMQLEHQVEALQQRVAELHEQNRSLEEALVSESRVFAVSRSGDVTPLPRGTRPRPTGTSRALVLWRPHRRR
ncbi:heat shock protein transcriptional repressor HspR [Ornithinicoccus halotolerans]|uniref:heat shock protein transcriptional repressor HspR n=1 Tax=Ornithinicoccus halotolerans TaxID=1748220 RepID=UPI00225E1965|nr:helix-turn-helix transcriptional regulator [Ornithinicoccus halotolerans]